MSYMNGINVAFIGFGTVGKGVYETIHSHQKQLHDITGKKVEVSTIVIQNPDKHQDIQKDIHITTDIQHIINNPAIDVVFEAIVGVEPAYLHIKNCIKAGKHMITANKEMFATHGQELKLLAEHYGVALGFDATTAGGIPVIQTIKQLLRVNQIQKIQAILNGTSNYILTEMREKQIPFHRALQQSQDLGYAESDPTNDVEGFDALFKLMILSDVSFGKQPLQQHIYRRGITAIKEEDLRSMQQKRIKHIATIEKVNGILTAAVEPLSISEDHPLFSTEGVDNAVHIQTDIVGDLILSGPGAGALPTASAMIEEFCTFFSQEQRQADATLSI